MSTLVLAGVAAAGTARAGVRAHVACTPDGGAVLVAGKPAALDKNVSCEVVIDRGAVPAGATVTIAASWDSPIGHVDGAPREAAGRPAATGARAVYGVPSAFSPGKDFMSCAKVAFQGRIAAGDKVLWKGALRLAGRCGRPTPVKAQLSCMAVDENNSPVPYPGLGTKQKPELMEGLTCTISSSADHDSGAFGVFGVRHAKAPLIVRPVTRPAEARAAMAFTQLMAPAVPRCRSFVVEGALLRSDGATLWKGHLAIPQVCNKHR